MAGVIIGHRGLAGQAPENTLAAIRAAAQAGLQWIELDVQLSSDQVPFIFHDDNLDRTSNGSGLAIQRTWPELQQLDAGSWFQADFQAEPIPSLAQALALIDSLALSLNLEIKINGPAAKLVSACAPLLRQHRGQLVLSSFEASAWLACRQQLPELRCSALLEQLPDGNQRQQLRQQGISGISVADSSWQPEWQRGLEPGWLTGVYTVNRLARAQSLIQQGVDWVFSDHALRL